MPRMFLFNIICVYSDKVKLSLVIAFFFLFQNLTFYVISVQPEVLFLLNLLLHVDKSG